MRWRDARQDPEMGCGEMPSEVIYGSSGGVDVRVSWGTHETGIVQVVTEATRRTDTEDPTERLIGMVNGWLEAAGEPTIDLDRLRAGTLLEVDAEPLFDGWWAHLSDWSQVNRLIKVLKRARDRQFGDPA